MPLLRRSLVALAGAMLFPAPAAAQETRPLIVFAAASLQTALKGVVKAWQDSTGKKATVSYAASSQLARQIEQGAPADIFASADQEWMDWVEKRGLIRSASRTNLLGNALVLIAAPGVATDLKIAPGFALAEALGESRLATGAVQTVPAGRYAHLALTALGVWDKVAPRIAGTENVRAALALVARGEARFGVVYETDARAEQRVRVVDRFPANSHPPIFYPFAIAASSKHQDAEAFLTFLTSPEARRIFEGEGFIFLK